VKRADENRWCLMGKIHKQEKGRKKQKEGAKDKKTVKTKLL
jgi:hypothetical protein